MEEITVLPAGCQPWSKHVVAVNGSRFAFCSTLACYVYELRTATPADDGSSESHEPNAISGAQFFHLKRIFTPHEKSITSLSWDPTNPNIIACTDVDNKLWVHDIQTGHSNSIPFFSRIRLVTWNPFEENCACVIEEEGNLRIVDVVQREKGNLFSFSESIVSIRWSFKRKGTVFAGDSHGGTHLLSIGSSIWKKLSCTHQRLDMPNTVHERTTVVDAQWDPLSESYILVGFKNETIVLYDTDVKAIIKTYSVRQGGFRSLAWISCMPGNFISTDTRGGIVRVWNVSQEQPMEIINIKEGIFHNLVMFNDNASLKTKAVCTFYDGGIGVYDLRTKKWDFIKEKGHVETIFGCDFAPTPLPAKTTPGYTTELMRLIGADRTLASCSFDGSLKLWRAGSQIKYVDAVPGENPGILYSLAWSADGTKVAASTDKGTVWIWDVAKHKFITALQLHKGFVFHVSWCKNEHSLIASGGADGFCCVFQQDGVLKHRYKHPKEVAGCDWNPHHPHFLTTGCMDGKVRIWDTSNESKNPVIELTGHSERSFSVAWSPILKNLLASGSDDCDARIWNVDKGNCFQLLSGHRKRVRALTWSQEIAYLILTGSWDYSIRIWDIRDGNCIGLIQEHRADVYGIATHMLQPFLFASVSRDNTLRLWQMERIGKVVMNRLILAGGKPSVLREYLFKKDQADSDPLSVTSTFKLSGKGSALLCEILEDENLQLVDRFAVILDFFSGSNGTRELWAVVKAALGEQRQTLSTDIRHANDVRLAAELKAQQLESKTLSKMTGGGMIGSKDERFKEASMLRLCLGDLRQYCEDKVTVGRWDEALAMAPALGIPYWRELLNRRASEFEAMSSQADGAMMASMSAEDPEPIAAAYAALGMSEKLFKLLSQSGDDESAFVVGRSEMDGRFNPPQLTPHPPAPPLSSISATEKRQKVGKNMMRQAMKARASRLVLNREFRLAAACFVAVNEIEDAIRLLAQHRLFEDAYCISVLFDLAAPAAEMEQLLRTPSPIL